MASCISSCMRVFFILFLSSFPLAATAFPNKGALDTYSTLALEGVVLCQDCKYVGTRSLSFSKPLPGAKVQLVCESGFRYKTSFSATARTDFNGFFYQRVPRFDFKRFAPSKDCVLYLLSSPPSFKCSTPTNINYGKSGARLRAQKSYSRYEAMYSVAALAFAPAPCKRPVVYYDKSVPPPVSKLPKESPLPSLPRPSPPLERLSPPRHTQSPRLPRPPPENWPSPLQSTLPPSAPPPESWPSPPLTESNSTPPQAPAHLPPPPPLTPPPSPPPPPPSPTPPPPVVVFSSPPPTPLPPPLAVFSSSPPPPPPSPPLVVFSFPPPPPPPLPPPPPPRPPAPTPPAAAEPAHAPWQHSPPGPRAPRFFFGPPSISRRSPPKP